MNQKIAFICALLEQSNEACRNKAHELIQLKEIPSTLAFRSLQLNAEEAERLLEAVALDQKCERTQLESISFSNNPTLAIEVRALLPL